MIFFFLLLVAMYVALVAQHFIGPLPVVGARVLLMPIIMFYGALALPTPGMLVLAFCGGLMWDALHTQIISGNVEIALGWSVSPPRAGWGIWVTKFQATLPAWPMGNPLPAQRRHLMIVLAEYLMITFRREPVIFLFNKEVWWQIGGAGLIAAFLSPFFFFTLNYLAFLVGYDTQPTREAKRSH